MPRERRRRLRLLALACVFVPVTAFFALAQRGQRVDAQNHALKDPNSTDRANLDRLADVVPGDAVVLLGFSVPGDLAILPGDRASLEECRRGIGELPGVSDTAAPPIDDPGLALVTVSLRSEDPVTDARRIVEFAHARAPTTLRVLATGLPLIEGRIADIVAAERDHVVPWLVGVLLVAATALYRSLRLGAAVLMPALAGIAWTGGLVALFGNTLDPVGALLDPVLLTIGVASSVHFVESHLRGRRDGLPPDEAATFASKVQVQPAFLATATTMVGLASLCTSSIPAVLDFGVRAAFGVALVHAFNFLLLPAWLATAKGGVAPAEPGPGAPSVPWLDAILRRRGLLLSATAAATAFALAGFPDLHTDNDPLTLLPATDPCRADHDTLAHRLGGVETFHLFAPERSPGTVASRLLPFVAAVHTLPGAAGLAGPARSGSEGDLAVPLLLSAGGSGVRAPLFDEIDRAARVLGLDGLVAAGPSVQIARDSVALMNGLFSSFWLTLLVLFLAASAGLRSFRLGALTMLPNLVPCLWVYGIVAWLGRPVSVATAMIASTMLGLIVDNSLHLLHDYRLHRIHEEPLSAVRTALRHCGRGMALSSGLLMLGFLVTATSRLATTIEFSLLATTTIAAGAFMALVVLPLLLAGADRRIGRQHAV
ncbi:MAG: MMPL family transporter [Planctomycetes bacterium]|nr:MMPL family transporter [Planctomycetota bacterium]